MTYDSNFSRRELLNILAMGPLASALLGCGGGSEVVPTLKFFGTGTLDIGKRNWERAKTALGLNIDFTDNGNDIGPVLAQMINGTAAVDYDIGGVQGGAEIEMARARVIVPWDLDKLPNWENVWDDLKMIPWANYQREQIALPIVVNADSIIYLQNEAGTVDSYAAVFDPKFKGRASMEDAWINSVIFTAIFMKANNIDGMAKIKQPGDLEEDELNSVIGYLKSKKRDGQFYKFWRGWQEGVDLIVSRRVAVMTGWEPIVYAAQEKGVNDVRYAVPREGYEGWSNNLVLHRGAVNRGLSDVAHRFANWQLSGEYGCILGALRGYMVPTDACINLLAKQGPIKYWNDITAEEAEVTSDRAVGLNEHVRGKFSVGFGSVYWQNTRPRNYPLYEKLWTELRSI